MKTIRSVLFIIIGAIALFYIVFFASNAKAQEPSISIKDFSGGLNTKTNPFNLKLNEFVQLHNYLLNAEFGSLVLRAGDIARTDSLDKTIPSDKVWECIVLDTATYFGSGQIAIIVNCDDTMPSQDGLLDGINVDSLNPLGMGGVAFTINTYRFIIDSQANFITDTAAGAANLVGIGDSISVTLTQAEFLSAVDIGGITGLYAFYSKPTTKLLMFVIPSFGSDNRWSALYASRSNQYNPTQKLADFIYKGETPLWETWNGFTYIALPRQRPMISNGTRTTMLVPRAPGQVEVVPVVDKGITVTLHGKNFAGVDSSSVTGGPDSLIIDTAAWNAVGGSAFCCDSIIDDSAWAIDGSVKYSLFRRHADTGAGLGNIMDLIGYVSHPIPIFDERNLIYGFPREASDTANTAVRSDSVLLYLVRTRGNPQETPKFIDSFFVIDSIISDNPSILDSFKIIDSIPNDSLGATSYPFIGVPKGIVPYDTGYVDSATDILNVSETIARSALFSAPGAPTFIGHTEADSANDWWPSVPDTLSLNRFHVGWEYGLTRFDTVLNQPIVSNMSPVLTVSTGYSVSFSGGNDSTTVITIGIPRRTALDTSQSTIVWRRQLTFSPNPDSFVVITDTVVITIRVGGGRGEPGEVRQTKIRTYKAHADTNIIRSAFFPIGFINNATDTIFIDSMNYVDWASGGATDRSIDLNARFNLNDNRMDIVKGFFAFKDNLFAWTDDRLFRSNLDEPVFEPFNDILFDPENGDVITQVTNVGPNLLVFYSNGLTELYDPLDILPTKGSPLDGFGCFAPQSLVNWGGSIYFGALDGIRTLSSHPVKLFGVANTVISRKINDQIIDGRSDSLKSTLVGTVGPDGQTLRFCYPSIDTTWIWHPPVNPGDDPLGAWTTRDFSFFQAIPYDTNSIEGLLRSGNTVYARTGDERVFDMEVNTATYIDSGLGLGQGTAVVGLLQTRPLFDDPNTWQISRIGLLRSGGVRNVTLSILSDDLTVLITELFLNTEPRYTVHAIGLNQSVFPSIRYALPSTAQQPDTLRRIDIWGRFIGSPWVR